MKAAFIKARTHAYSIAKQMVRAELEELGVDISDLKIKTSWHLTHLNKGLAYITEDYNGRIIGRGKLKIRDDDEYIKYHEVSK